MLTIDESKYLFKVKRIFFSEHPFDVKGCSNVAFYYCRNKLDVPGFTGSETVTSVIDLTQSLEEIWGNMGKKSCRYAIKRAQRDGVEVKMNQGYGEFYQIYKSFSKQKDLYGLEKLETIKKVGTLFVAKLGEEIVSGHVYLEDKDIIMYWLAATKRLSADKERATLIGNASHLMHWEAIKYAKEKGIKEFDMGGLASAEGKDYPRYSIDAFKRSFGGRPVTRYNYFKDYTWVYTIGRYFYLPLYRWVSKIK